MKQIFMSNKGRKIKNVPLPTPGDREILVQVYASVISTGTEIGSNKKKSFAENLKEKQIMLKKALHLVSEKGLSPTIQLIKEKLLLSEQYELLQPIGYSNAGLVISKGRFVTEFNIGDRVACCGSGIAAHAEYVTIPKNLAAKLKENVEYEAGAFSTIGSIAMHGIRRTDVQFGETIIITGLGLLGLLAVQIAKAWGLIVIGVDIDERRNQLAKALGADACFNASDPEISDKVLQFTNGIGVDAAIIYAATKNSAPVNQAFDFCRRKGRVVAVGLTGLDLDRNKMYAKELDLYMSTSYGPGRYDEEYEIRGHDYPIAYVRWTENRNIQEFIRLLSIGQVDVKPLVSGKYDVLDAISAFDSLMENSNNIANVILYNLENKKKEVEKSVVLNSAKSISKEKINVGIIGAGSFVKSYHISNILKLKDHYEILSICNNKPGSSTQEGQTYNVEYVTTDYRELLMDDRIDLIIIGSRHNLHAEMVIKSIEAKKNVLVEKPLAMTIDEIGGIKKAIAENIGINVFVGFNRRYSPFIQTIKKKVLSSQKPIVINYRINAGYIPSTSWIQNSEIGGGRLIGEGCHFIDLISYISDGVPIEADIVSIPITNNYTSEDNYIITLKYDNGNIGVLTYTSTGSKAMSKENLEVFCDKTSYVIDDFHTLREFKNDTKETKLSEADKGHSKMILEIAHKLTGKSSLIEPFEKDIKSSELAINLFNDIYGNREKN